MKIDKDSMDFHLNMEILHEMEDLVPMTRSERRSLRKWVLQGNEVESNPWDYCDGDGIPLNFLQAFRLHYGYSSGPWDYWKGPYTQLYWDNDRKTFISPDDFC